MAISPTSDHTVYQRPVELLRNLIRFDTTNPPGNEEACVTYVGDLLSRAGVESTLLALEPTRPNLIARLKGEGNAPPLLLYGHVDVVTTANQEWTHPPFEARLVDGFVWGRGALDMKAGVTMMLTAFLRAKAEGIVPAGDVVLAILSDEEAGGNYGAKYLVENHSDEFDGIRYALGEFGGATIYIAGQKFYPIQIAEKQMCWMKATVRGPGGHGARPMRGGAMAKVGQFLQRLDQHRLPVHITPVTRQMVEATSSALPEPSNALLLSILDTSQTDSVLDQLGAQGTYFDPLLHNTVNATIIRGGNKVNVIPSEIEIELDGRLLPGLVPADLIREIHQIVGEDVELEVLRHDPGPVEPDLGLFDTLAGVLADADPDGTPMPLLLPGVTDGRYFAQLGIQTYGFTPMKLPPGFEFTKLVHAADERIPVDALEFGTQAIFSALQRYGR